MLRFIVVGLAGMIGGMFFAQKSGKKLRTQLKGSKTPLKQIFKELKDVSGESYETIKDWAENSEELKGLINQGKSKLKNVGKEVTKLGKEAYAEAKQDVKSLASKSKKTTKKTVAKTKKTTQKTAKNFTNKLKDKS